MFGVVAGLGAEVLAVGVAWLRLSDLDGSLSSGFLVRATRQLLHLWVLGFRV